MSAVDPTAGNDDLAELEGSLPDLPELSWEDFERASELAQRDGGWVRTLRRV